MTAQDLSVLKANIDKRVEITCVDGEVILGDVLSISSDAVVLDPITGLAGGGSDGSALSVRFDEIASVCANPPLLPFA